MAKEPKPGLPGGMRWNSDSSDVHGWYFGVEGAGEEPEVAKEARRAIAAAPSADSERANAIAREAIAALRKNHTPG